MFARVFMGVGIGLPLLLPIVMLVDQTNTWVDHALGPLAETEHTSTAQMLRLLDKHEMRNCHVVYILGVEGNLRELFRFMRCSYKPLV